MALGFQSNCTCALMCTLSLYCVEYHVHSCVHRLQASEFMPDPAGGEML